MLWIKSLHIVFVVTWYAGLFYLPRLFVYHAMADDRVSIERFKVMERKLYRGIMMPSMVLALLTGLTLWLHYGIGGTWMLIKFSLVLVLVATHFWFGSLMRAFAADRNRHGHVFYRWINEIPAAPILLLVVILVVVKPF
jgi:putative membrane protein